MSCENTLVQPDFLQNNTVAVRTYHICMHACKYVQCCCNLQVDIDESTRESITGLGFQG